MSVVLGCVRVCECCAGFCECCVRLYKAVQGCVRLQEYCIWLS